MTAVGKTGDTQTEILAVQLLVSICASTIPNCSRTAPTKSGFLYIFNTGVAGNRGDPRDNIALDKASAFDFIFQKG